MFARVSTFGASTKQARETMSKGVPPEVRALAGFRGAYALLDSKEGKAMLITLWETEKDMQSSLEVAQRVRGETAADAGATAPPVVETYEVLSQP